MSGWSSSNVRAKQPDWGFETIVAAVCTLIHASMLVTWHDEHAMQALGPICPLHSSSQSVYTGAVRERGHTCKRMDSCCWDPRMLSLGPQASTPRPSLRQAAPRRCCTALGSVVRQQPLQLNSSRSGPGPQILGPASSCLACDVTARFRAALTQSRSFTGTCPAALPS